MSPVIQTLCDLVRINTVNPAYGDGGTEGNAESYLEQFFQRYGIETFKQEVFPGRSNVIAVLPGKSKDRIVFEAHTDTVSIKGMTIPPFEPRVADGRVYGRGSVDDKAGLAAMMHALVELKTNQVTPPCEVWLAAAVDEEYSYRGVVKLCENISAKAAIVAEPTELRQVIASKGVLRWRVTTKGKSAHSSKPHLGVNAIQHMAKILAAFEQENERLATVSHSLLTPPTLSVGTIQGGVQVNLVPDYCSIEIDRRLMPGEKAGDVLEYYRSLVKSIPGIDADCETPVLLEDEALDTPADAEVVKVASQILGDMSLNKEPMGVPFGSDASKLSRAGIPTIVFGPGSIDQAHTVDEWVPVDQVETALKFYRSFAETFGT
ncbi:MAG: M20 family metallopeptidase [Verrucomicrobiaceae bacterium]|nr:M20 family metallopeptidase [Verrucomicrobiaceae bacterium]